MTPTRSPRWLMSFADLCLLLLGFFVLLHARADGSAAAASVRAAFGGDGTAAPRLELAAAPLFEPGEAVLKPSALRQLQLFGHRLSGSKERVQVTSQGRAEAGSRFDGWELTAARAAAVARAVAAGGVAPARIDIVLPQGQDRLGPARLTIEG